MNSDAKLYLDNQLCFPLYAASRLTTKLYEPFLHELDITYPQYLVLLVLWQQNNLSVNEIGNKLFLESNTLTPLLKRLEQKQIISRNRSEIDERKVLIALTPKGENLKTKAALIPDKLLNLFSEEDSLPHEIESFQKTLKKWIHVLNQKLK